MLARDFYSEYHGHRVQDLEALNHFIRTEKSGDSSYIIYLAGDSSLDNKFYVHRYNEAVNSYENILSPPTSKLDIAYYINR